MELRKKKRAISNKEFNFTELFKRCLAFSILFLFIGLFVCLIMSFIIYKFKDNTSLINIGSIASLFISVMATAFIQSKYNGKYYLLGSITLGILIFLVTIIIALILNSGSITTNNILVKSLIPAFSVLGGMLGIKKEKARKRKHR